MNATIKSKSLGLVKLFSLCLAVVGCGIPCDECEDMCIDLCIESGNMLFFYYCGFLCFGICTSTCITSETLQFCEDNPDECADLFGYEPLEEEAIE